jgi:hypothetical protein
MGAVISALIVIRELKFRVPVAGKKLMSTPEGWPLALKVIKLE